LSSFHRLPLEFGTSTVRLCRLEVKDRAQRQWQRELRRQRRAAAGIVSGTTGQSLPGVIPESSSSSGPEDGDDLVTTKDENGFSDDDQRGGKKHKHARDVLNWTERTWHLYYKSKPPPIRDDDESSNISEAMPPTMAIAETLQRAKPDPLEAARPKRKPPPTAEDLLRRAADMRERWGADVAPPESLHPLPSIKRLEEAVDNKFHQDFRSSNLILGDGNRTAERPKKGTPQPGMVVLSRPLRVRGAVCPDKYKARGVNFDVKIERVDRGWKDGIGIGFTAQNPDQWPDGGLRPRHAANIPRTCMCGYSGRWMVDGCSELIYSTRLGPGLWEPGALRVGDVVSAVFATEPADVVRILVNGRSVAERPASTSGLPDPNDEPLWGVVELDGACLKVRLGGGVDPNRMVGSS